MTDSSNDGAVAEGVHVELDALPAFLVGVARLCLQPTWTAAGWRTASVPPGEGPMSMRMPPAARSLGGLLFVLVPPASSEMAVGAKRRETGVLGVEERRLGAIRKQRGVGRREERLQRQRLRHCGVVGVHWPRLLESAEKQTGRHEDERAQLGWHACQGRGAWGWEHANGQRRPPNTSAPQTVSIGCGSSRQRWQQRGTSN